MPAHLLQRGWPRRLTPTAPSQPEPFEPKTVSLAVLPDTQYYASCRSPHLRAQSDWIAESARERNIAAVLQLGDLTEHNTIEEWEYVRGGLEPVWRLLPTFLATGNHDHGDGGTANRRWTRFRDYFSDPSPPTARAVAATLEPSNLENAYYRLPLPKVTLGILVLEWSPRSTTVRWANAVLTAHATDRVIIVTHAYLYHDSTRYDWAAKGRGQEWNPNAYGTAGSDTHDGEHLWLELGSRHAGVFLILNGHVLGDGAGLASAKGGDGNLVHQVLVNYQMLDEGGLGYLRLLELLPSGAELRMSTYSPSLGQWATAPDQHFQLSITPPLWD